LTVSVAPSYGDDHAPSPYWPTDIRYDKSRKLLTLVFNDGVTFEFPAELLRVESPSAEVQGHGPGQKQLVAGRRHVGITAIEPVGRYAIRLVFDDLHDTGLYSWRYLRDLGQRQEAIWQDYLDRLKAAGATRNP